jgi:hypothetical protein
MESPIKVTKVKQRYPAAEALPETKLPKHIKHVTKWALVCIAALWLCSLVIMLV